MSRPRGRIPSAAIALVPLALLLTPRVDAAEIPHGRVQRFEVPAPSLHEAQRDVQVYLPPSYDAPAARGRRYPVVFLLHGFPGTAGDWFGRAHAAETADTLIARGEAPEVILVSPDGNRGFFGRTLFANAYDGSFDMNDFVRRDLVTWVDSMFRTRERAADRGVIGLSDGGTAAVNLALRHPEVFGAAGAHSADYLIHRDYGIGKIVGPADEAAPRLAALSPLEYLRGGLAVPDDPVLYLDCGVDDESIAQNRQFDRLLDSLHVAHEFHAFPGSHTWGYWRAHFVQSLRAVTRGMGEGEGGDRAEATKSGARIEGPARSMPRARGPRPAPRAALKT